MSLGDLTSGYYGIFQKTGNKLLQDTLLQKDIDGRRVLKDYENFRKELLRFRLPVDKLNALQQFQKNIDKLKGKREMLNLIGTDTPGPSYSYKQEIPASPEAAYKLRGKTIYSRKRKGK